MAIETGADAKRHVEVLVISASRFALAAVVGVLALDALGRRRAIATVALGVAFLANAA